MKKITLISLLLFALQIQAEMQLKHGLYLSQSLGNISADISGKHQDFEGFDIGAPDPDDITNENANVYDTKVSNIRSLGYNLKYAPEVGFGYEFGIYLTEIKAPHQNAALIHDDGKAFKITAPSGSKTDIIVDSPSSHIQTFDFYVGGLYNFAKINQNYTPYIGAGYAKVYGDWYNSYYRGMPGADPRYGTEGKTKVSGHYTSIKSGVHFNQNYSLELEYTKYKLHADSFRSFNINGSDVKFNNTSLNFIYNF